MDILKQFCYSYFRAYKLRFRQRPARLSKNLRSIFSILGTFALCVYLLAYTYNVIYCIDEWSKWPWARLRISIQFGIGVHTARLPRP
ncbi:hypothetical protein EJ08DRAFT_235644 [Tothia fuscella]|uniref:Uncharacterized protein n=1 Tax=Tothia fuscella TaxID=1048955 RepID=A0A9P4NSI2_9PEZI|nr:hypothetical protein EJ08DRAFT_235644 [Tothia fuscella]